MTLTTHAAIGAWIGTVTGNPGLAFLIGLTSHFLVDIIPHGDRTLYDGHRKGTAERRARIYVTMDAIVAIIVVALMFSISHRSLNPMIAAGIIGAVIPDLLVGIYEAWRTPFLKPFHRFHFFFHNIVSNRTGDIALSHALVAQAILIVLIQKYF